MELKLRDGLFFFSATEKTAEPRQGAPCGEASKKK